MFEAGQHIARTDEKGKVTNSQTYHVREVREDGSVKVAYRASYARSYREAEFTADELNKGRFRLVCGEMVWTGYDSHTCGRLIKDEGESKCRVHLAAERRVERRRQEDAHRAAIRYRASQAMQERINALGIEGVYRGEGSRVSIPLSVLEELVAKAADAELARQYEEAEDAAEHQRRMREEA